MIVGLENIFPPESTHSLFVPERKKKVTSCSSRNLINGYKVTLTFNKAIRGIPYSQLHKRLQLLQCTHALMPLHYSRDKLCSGLDWKITAEILRKDDVFRPFAKFFERKMKVYSLWVIAT